MKFEEIMENLFIKRTKNTPQISFDGKSGVCEISGFAFPNNSSKFWRPVFQWLNEYVEKGNEEITFKFKLSNQNVGTTKAIFGILSLLESYKCKGIRTRAFWYCNDDDMIFKDIWKELTEDLTIPNFLISYDSIVAGEEKIGTLTGNNLQSLDRFFV